MLQRHIYDQIPLLKLPDLRPSSSQTSFILVSARSGRCLCLITTTRRSHLHSASLNYRALLLVSHPHQLVAIRFPVSAAPHRHHSGSPGGHQGHYSVSWRPLCRSNMDTAFRPSKHSFRRLHAADGVVCARLGIDGVTGWSFQCGEPGQTESGGKIRKLWGRITVQHMQPEFAQGVFLCLASTLPLLTVIRTFCSSCSQSHHRLRHLLPHKHGLVTGRLTMDD